MSDKVFVVIGVALLLVSILSLSLDRDMDTSSNFYICEGNYINPHLVELPVEYTKVITLVYDTDALVCNKVVGFLEWSEVNDTNTTN